MKICPATGNECSVYTADMRTFDIVDTDELDASRILVNKCEEGLMLGDFEAFETSCGAVALELAKRQEIEDAFDEIEETRVG